MKKNYMKPSLLSETFVANNIMNGMATDPGSFLSSASLADDFALFIGGERREGITFTSGNTLQSVSVNNFNK